MIKLRRNYLYMTIVILLLIMIPFIGIGFSALQTVLNIRGDVLVEVPQDPIIGDYYKSLNNTYLSSQYKNLIKYVSFENEVNIPDNAVNYWDISADDSGMVMAYLVNNSVNSTMFDLHIQGEGNPIANENASYMFRYINNVDTITNAELLDVSNTKNMYFMFSNAGSRATTYEIGDLSNWDTSNVSYMNRMFKEAGYSATTWNSIGTLEIYKTQQPYTTNLSEIFQDCPNAKATLKLYNNPDYYDDAFQGAATVPGSGITVDYTSEVTDIDNIIATKSSNSNVVKGSLFTP